MLIIQKILIIGGPETGKTTFSKELQKLSNLPVFSLDSLKFTVDWKKRNHLEIKRKLAHILSQSSWIIEGNSETYWLHILKYADLVIFLDFPLYLQIKGIFTRFMDHCFVNYQLIPKCKYRIRFQFLVKTLFFNLFKRPKIKKNLRKYNAFFLISHNFEETDYYLNILSRIKKKKEFIF